MNRSAFGASNKIAGAAISFLEYSAAERKDLARIRIGYAAFEEAGRKRERQSKFIGVEIDGSIVRCEPNVIRERVGEVAAAKQCVAAAPIENPRAGQRGGVARTHRIGLKVESELEQWI